MHAAIVISLNSLALDARSTTTPHRARALLGESIELSTTPGEETVGCPHRVPGRRPTSGLGPHARAGRPTMHWGAGSWPCCKSRHVSPCVRERSPKIGPRSPVSCTVRPMPPTGAKPSQSPPAAGTGVWRSQRQLRSDGAARDRGHRRRRTWRGASTRAPHRRRGDEHGRSDHLRAGQHRPQAPHQSDR